MKLNEIELNEIKSDEANEIKPNETNNKLKLN